jgi:hypothetical protein
VFEEGLLGTNERIVGQRPGERFELHPLASALVFLVIGFAPVTCTILSND